MLRNYGALFLLAGLLTAMTPACGSAEPTSETLEATELAHTLTPTATASATWPAPTSTPTVDPSIAWTIGEPVPLPEGMTIVLGTGCNHCDGEFSTFVRFDAAGVTELREEGEEVHVSGHFEELDHLFLSTCINFDACVGPTDALTTLYESFDRGATWERVMATPTLHEIRGRTLDGELLIDPAWPSNGNMYLYPSEEPITAPTEASDSVPRHVGDMLLWATREHEAIDRTGTVVADFSEIVPTGAELWHVSQVPEGGFFIVWDGLGQSSGAALIEDDVLVPFDGRPFAQFEASWLDDTTFVTSVEYPDNWRVGATWHPGFGSRTPTFVDLETRTLHPILEFLAPDAPQGRNTIEAVWQD